MRQPTGGWETVTSFLQWALSAVGGALVMLVGFRTRMALADRKVQELERDISARLNGIERRQALTLEIVADIASKMGVDARFGDALVRFLSEEARLRRERDDIAQRGD